MSGCVISLKFKISDLYKAEKKNQKKSRTIKVESIKIEKNLNGNNNNKKI